MNYLRRRLADLAIDVVRLFADRIQSKRLTDLKYWLIQSGYGQQSTKPWESSATE